MKRTREENAKLSARCRKYEKTKKGFLMRAHRNMRNRCAGRIMDRSIPLYEGLQVLDREDFYNFSLNDPEFNALFEEWENSGYDRKLTPSPDRFDSSIGYTVDNIQWVDFSTNCRRGAESRWGLV